MSLPAGAASDLVCGSARRLHLQPFDSWRRGPWSRREVGKHEVVVGSGRRTTSDTEGSLNRWHLLANGAGRTLHSKFTGLPIVVADSRVVEARIWPRQRSGRSPRRSPRLFPAHRRRRFPFRPPRLAPPQQPRMRPRRALVFRGRPCRGQGCEPGIVRCMERDPAMVRRPWWPPRLADVAERSGVSLATASRAWHVRMALKVPSAGHRGDPHRGHRAGILAHRLTSPGCTFSLRHRPHRLLGDALGGTQRSPRPRCRDLPTCIGGVAGAMPFHRAMCLRRSCRRGCRP